MSVSKVAETNVSDGQKGYKEVSMGEMPPLPAVEEMDGAARNRLHLFIFHFHLRERWEYALYPIFCSGANKFAHCILNKVEVESFLRSRQVSSIRIPT